MVQAMVCRKAIVMKILHLPLNIASQITVTVRALRDLGVQAQGIAFPGIVTANEHILLLSNRKYGFIRNAFAIIRAIAWADAVHWYYHYALKMALDLWTAKILNRKRIVEFWGSDIRIPEIEASDNPYYAKFFSRTEYSYAESRANSLARQRVFAGFGTDVLLPCPSLRPYLQNHWFDRVHNIRQRVYLPEYVPIYPDISRCPLIIHSPTAPILKGTPVIEATVQSLQSVLSFEYRRVQNMTHLEARKIMQECDIFVDQIIIGSYGLAALEAMAFGKPVVCYIKPSMLSQYPPDLPVVNATIETLPEVLARLIEDGALRRELGRRGREYVEKYHNAHELARQLLQIYQSLK